MSDSTWFDGAGLGMFVHWGHSSQQGVELSWPMVGGVAALSASQGLPVAEYQRTASTFDPKPGAAKEWMRLAREAGMTYAVFTARHHDGFSMFRTKHSDFSIESSPYEGDLVAEFVDAARSEGLRVGLYYSLSDWHHPDYPAWTDDDRPYMFGFGRRSTPEAWERYLGYLSGQLTELLTNYGAIDLLWFDGGWERTIAEWRSDELRELIRDLQPATLVNDRLPGHGDFTTPEQFIPPQAPEGRWETCMTMNESWAWNPSDEDYKSATTLVHTLAEVASRGGNLLLNVGPRGDGSLPDEQVERVRAVGEWMASHGRSIVGTRPGLEPWQFYGPSTRRDTTVFLHLLWRPYERVVVRGLPVKQVKSVREMRSGTELPFTTRCSILDTMFNSNPIGEIALTIPEALLDAHATVLEVELASA